MRAASVSADRGRTWIACGITTAAHDIEHWFGMTLVYFVIAAALKLIPFVGDLLVVLLTPLLLAGALLALRDRGETEPAGAGFLSKTRAGWRERKWRGLTDVFLLAPARMLFQATRREEYLFPAIILCILTLGMVIVVGILEYLLTGGSIISGLAASSLSAPLTVTLILRMLLLIAVYVVLTMALFYVVPLTLFDGLPPMAALAESFEACRNNAGALLYFCGTFLVPCIAILYVFTLSPSLGYLLVFTLGLLLLPAFIAGAWCSYRELYHA